MKTTYAAVLLLLSGSCLALAQQQMDVAPKPGPEVQALSYYAGTWKGEGETKGGPFGPAGKLSSEMTCEVFTGGFQLVCRGEERGPTGTRAFLNIKSFDQTTRTYTEYSVSSLGESEYSQGGTLAGGKLTYMLNAGEGEGAARVRYTEEHVSPVLMTYRIETSVKGGPWQVIAEGRIRKVE